MGQNKYQAETDRGAFVYAVPSIVYAKDETHFLGYVITEEAEATVRLYVEPIYPETLEGAKQ